MSTPEKTDHAPEAPAPPQDKSALRTVLFLVVPAVLILIWAMFFKNN